MNPRTETEQPTTQVSSDDITNEWWQAFIAQYSTHIRSWIANNVDWQIFNGSVDIDDIEQEVYVRLLKNDCRALTTFFNSTRSSDLATYLYRITQNTIIDAVRTPRKRHSIAPMVGGFVDTDKIEDVLDDLDAEREFSMIYEDYFPNLDDD